jgi:hypothetical protein
VAWLTFACVCLLWQRVALTYYKLTHGGTGGQLIFPEVIMSGLHYGDTLGRKIKATEEQKQEQRCGDHVCNIQ